MPEYADFTAPWGSTLKLLTVGVSAVLIVVPLMIILTLTRSSSLWWIHVSIPFGILIVTSAFMIRGYRVTGDTLYINRLGWQSKIDLSELESVEFNPGAVSGSIRTFGNGGLFCIAGKFSNKQLGSYRMFATDTSRVVVLRFPKQPVVVTPGEPEEFIRYIKQMKAWK